MIQNIEKPRFSPIFMTLKMSIKTTSKLMGFKIIKIATFARKRPMPMSRRNMGELTT